MSMRRVDGAINPKPTAYRGIPMRSKLETQFAAHLDREGFAWEYEPKIFGPVGAGYMPDFLIHERGDHMYIEVKPTLEKADAAKDRMKVIWHEDPNAVLVMVSGDGWWQVTAKGRAWETWREFWRGFRA